VPWRFSDAGRRSVGLGRRSRRPKTCTKAAIGPPYSITSQAAIMQRFAAVAWVLDP